MLKKLKTIVCIFISVLTISISASGQVSNSKGTETILEDFSNPGLVLLVETSHNGMYKEIYNRRLVKDCNKYFKGKSEIAYANELNDKFSDKQVYRYYLTSRVIKSYRNTEGTERTIKAFFLYDRVTDTNIDLKTKYTFNNKGALKIVFKKLNSYLTSK